MNSPATQVLSTQPRCHGCLGTGQVKADIKDATGKVVKQTDVKCPYCMGTGRMGYHTK